MVIFLLVLPWIMIALAEWYFDRKRVPYPHVWHSDTDARLVGDPTLKPRHVIRLVAAIAVAVVVSLAIGGPPTTTTSYVTLIVAALFMLSWFSLHILCIERTWLRYGADVLTIGGPCTKTRHYPWATLKTGRRRRLGYELDFGPHGLAHVDTKKDGADALIATIERHLERNRAGAA